MLADVLFSRLVSVSVSLQGAISQHITIKILAKCTAVVVHDNHSGTLYIYFNNFYAQLNDLASHSALPFMLKRYIWRLEHTIIQQSATNIWRGETFWFFGSISRKLRGRLPKQKNLNYTLVTYGREIIQETVRVQYQYDQATFRHSLNIAASGLLAWEDLCLGVHMHRRFTIQLCKAEYTMSLLTPKVAPCFK